MPKCLCNWCIFFCILEAVRNSWWLEMHEIKHETMILMSPGQMHLLYNYLQLLIPLDLWRILVWSIYNVREKGTITFKTFHIVSPCQHVLATLSTLVSAFNRWRAQTHKHIYAQAHAAQTHWQHAHTIRYIINNGHYDIFIQQNMTVAKG